MSTSKVWKHQEETRVRMLLLCDGWIYYASQSDRAHNRAMTALHAGYPPDEAMEKWSARFHQRQLDAVRHPHGAREFGIHYTDDRGKKHEVSCDMGSADHASKVAAQFAGMAGLAVAPREDRANIAEFTIKPAAIAVLLVLVFGVLYLYAASVDPGARVSIRKLRLVHRMAGYLGTGGSLMCLGLSILGCLGWWGYLYMYRPPVDVYDRAVCEAPKTRPLPRV